MHFVETKTRICRHIFGPNFHKMKPANVLKHALGFRKNAKLRGVVPAKSVLNCQFCTFKDMSVESKGLHAQNFVGRK